MDLPILLQHGSGMVWVPVGFLCGFCPSNLIWWGSHLVKTCGADLLEFDPGQNGLSGFDVWLGFDLGRLTGFGTSKSPKRHLPISRMFWLSWFFSVALIKEKVLQADWIILMCGQDRVALLDARVRRA